MTALLGKSDSWSFSCCFHLIFILVFFGLSNVSGDLHLDVGTEAVSESEESFDVGKATLLIGGNKTEKSVESLSGRSFCSNGVKPLPVIRFAASACYLKFPEPSLMLCGGREDLFSLLDTCWIYTWSRDTWHLGENLPESVAGAATVCQDDRMMMIGGVVEEDYYQDSEREDYYDYNMEVATSKVLEYNARSMKWENGLSIPEPLQGSCATSTDDMVIITGGKNDKDCEYGSKNIWILDEENDKWKKGPAMNQARFHHGCIVTQIDNELVAMVVGGLGPDHVGDSVESLSLTGNVYNARWRTHGKLRQPHPNHPLLAHLSGHLMVIGGGGYQYPGGKGVAEVLTKDEWTVFPYLGVDRSFGVNIEVPAEFTKKCDMEPNYGGHSYFRRRGEMWLSEKFWFCHGDKLRTPLNSDQKQIVARCTIPGCQYYQTPADMVTRATHGCTIQKDLYSVQCTINCTKGFTPLGGQDTTTCTRSSQSWDIRFLECEQI